MSPSPADQKRLGFDPGRLARLRPWMERYVELGRYPGAATLVARHGELALLACVGARDAERGTAWSPDTLARIYSMTKPVTSVALLMLYEEGRLHLDDPVEAFLPEFASPRVLRPGATSLEDTTPARTRPTIHHLLTHTAGLTYGFNGDVLGRAYLAGQLGTDFTFGSLDEMVRRIAALPLEFEPGERWHYSVATDVVGRLVEVVSGQPLDRFMAERILGPLGMHDTFFAVPDDKLARFASLYAKGPDGRRVLSETPAASPQRAGRLDTLLGGAGLVSTVTDYWRFGEMLRRSGRCEDGSHLLAPRTVRFMTANHLPGDIASMGPRTWAETSFEGVGFGLGVWSMLDPVKARLAASPGDFGWGGMASTVCWVDPREDLVVVFLTQLVPSDSWPNRKELRTLVHQALVD